MTAAAINTRFSMLLPQPVSAPIIPPILPNSKPVAIHAVHYNFAGIRRSLRMTPAMAAGLSDHGWSLEEIVLLANRDEPHGAHVAVLWTGWIAYTCFKRAIHPPQKNSSWWHMESHTVDKICNFCVENQKNGASLRIRLAARASPGKSIRVTAAPYTCPRRHSAIKLRLRRLSL